MTKHDFYDTEPIPPQGVNPRAIFAVVGFGAAILVIIILAGLLGVS